MAERQYGVSCPGEPCALKEKPETHSHIPTEERLPNKLVVSEDVKVLADTILKSYTGLAGDEEKAWREYEIEKEIEASLKNIGNTVLMFAEAERV